MRRLFGRAEPGHPLSIGVSPITDLALGGARRFFVGRSEGALLAASVQAEDEVRAGQVLCEGGRTGRRVSPVQGRVAGVKASPDVRGGKPGLAVHVEPAEESSPVGFEPLDPREADVDALVARLEEAGVLTDELAPRPLAALLRRGDAPVGGTVVVLAADREPAVCVAVQLLRDRTADAADAAQLLGRIAGADRVLLAVPAPLTPIAAQACGGRDVQVLPLPPRYPETLEPLVAQRAGGPDVPVIALEAALAALDAVRHGRVQEHKVVTVIGRTGVVGNFRVPLGARIGDVMAAAGVKPRERDKVVAGGPMRGYAQYTLEAAIDTGIDALSVVPPAQLRAWTDQPCINCGTCVDVCPAGLQVQSIGRYAEFGLFDDVPALGIGACIECGLCAAVCVARRPLLQLIRLARQEIAGAAPEPNPGLPE